MMKLKLVNFIAFQVGWFSCVLSAANGLPWVGLIVVVAIDFMHLKSANDSAHELRLIVLAVALGLIFDSILVSSGWVRYPSGMFFPGVAPYWILAMWALFATTLNLSMGWLKGNWLLAAVMGAVFGPLSYLAGQRLGAIEMVDLSSSIIALAIIWAVVMPILTYAAGRFDGRQNALPLVPLQELTRRGKS